MAITSDQMHAVRVTFGNVENLYYEMADLAIDIKDGMLTLAQAHDMYAEDFSACYRLAKEINKCFTWADVKPCDIPQAVYDYLMEEFNC